MNMITRESSAAWAEGPPGGANGFRKRAVSAIDASVGARLRTVRREAGMSRRVLAERLDLSVQQLSKYEAGINRVSVSLLYHAAEALAVPVQALLIEAEAEAEAAPRDPAPGLVCLQDEEAAVLRFVLRNMRGPDPRARLLAFVAEMVPTTLEASPTAA